MAQLVQIKKNLAVLRATQKYEQFKKTSNDTLDFFIESEFYPLRDSQLLEFFTILLEKSSNVDCSISSFTEELLYRIVHMSEFTHRIESLMNTLIAYLHTFNGAWNRSIINMIIFIINYLDDKQIRNNIEFFIKNAIVQVRSKKLQELERFITLVKEMYKKSNLIVHDENAVEALMAFKEIMFQSECMQQKRFISDMIASIIQVRLMQREQLLDIIFKAEIDDACLYDYLEIMQKILIYEVKMAESYTNILYILCNNGLNTLKPGTYIKALECLALLMRTHQLEIVDSELEKNLLKCFANIDSLSSIPQLNSTLLLYVEYISLHQTRIIDLNQIMCFQNHEDPAVRSNVILIYQKYLSRHYVSASSLCTRSFTHIVQFVKNSVRDEAHSVIKQAISFYTIFLKYLDHTQIALMVTPDFIHESFEILFSVFQKSYWLTIREIVELTCCPDLRNLENIIGYPSTINIQERFLKESMLLLNSSDPRIRNYVADKFAIRIADKKYFNADQRSVLNIHNICINLFDLHNKYNQIGSLRCLTQILQHSNPMENDELWIELGLLQILSDHLVDSTLILDAEYHILAVDSITKLLKIHNRNISKNVFNLNGSKLKISNHITKVLRIYYSTLESIKTKIGDSTPLQESEIDSQSESMYAKINVTVGSLHDIYTMSLNAIAKENFLAILLSTLGCVQCYYEIFDLLEFNTNTYNQLVYFTKLAYYFPVECIDTAIYLMGIVENTVAHERSLDTSKSIKSFHEIDDRLVKQLKTLISNFVNLYSENERLVNDKLLLLMNKALRIGYTAEDIDPMSVIIKSCKMAMTEPKRSITKGFCEYYLRNILANSKPNFKNMVEFLKVNALVHHNIIDENLVQFVEKLLVRKAVESHLNELNELSECIENIMFEIFLKESKLVPFLWATLQHFSKKKKIRFIENLIHLVLVKDLVIKDYEQLCYFKMILSLPECQYNIDTTTISSLLYADDAVISKAIPNCADVYSVVAVIMVLIKIPDVALLLHTDSVIDFLSKQFLNIIVTLISFNSVQEFDSIFFDVLNILQTLSKTHPIVNASVKFSLNKYLPQKVMHQLCVEHPAISIQLLRYFCCNSLEGPSHGNAGRNIQNYCYLLRLLEASQNLHSYKEFAQVSIQNKTIMSGYNNKINIYELIVFWWKFGVSFVDIPKESFNSIEYFSNHLFQRNKNNTKLLHTQCLQKDATLFLKDLFGGGELKEKTHEVDLKGYNRNIDILEVGLSILLDRKGYDVVNGIFSKPLCKTTSLNLVRIIIRIEFKKLLAFVKRKAFEQQNFSLNSSIISIQLKSTMHYFVTKLTSLKHPETALLWCDFFGNIFKLKKICDHHSVVVTTWYNLVMLDLLGNCNEDSILKLKENCLISISATDMTNLSCTLNHINLMNKLVLLQDMLNLTTIPSETFNDNILIIIRKVHSIQNAPVFSDIVGFILNNTGLKTKPIIFYLKETTLSTLHMLGSNQSNYCNWVLDNSGIKSIVDFVLGKMWIKDSLCTFIHRVNFLKFSNKLQFEELFASLLIIINSLNSNDYTEQEFHQFQNILFDCASEVIKHCHTHLTQYVKSDLWDEPLIKNNFNNFINKKVWLNKLNNVLLTSADKDFPKRAYNNRQKRICIADILDYDQRQKRKRNYNCLHRYLEIDIQSALLTLVEALENQIFNGNVCVYPYYVKTIFHVTSSEKFVANLNMFQNLHSTVVPEDTIAIQYLTQLVFRCGALSIPSVEDVNKLMSISKFNFSSKQPYVKNAALLGLNDLLQSLRYANHVIGGLSDELIHFSNGLTDILLRKDDIGKRYHVNYSLYHQQLKWDLIGLAINTISNKKQNCDILRYVLAEEDSILKNAINHRNLLQFSKIFIEMLVTVTLPEVFYKKAIKICLVTLDNEGLQYETVILLLIALYAGSSDELNNIQEHNGIVQYDSESTLLPMEVVECLLKKLKFASKDEAVVLGSIVTMVAADTMSPIDVISKIVKDFFMENQLNQDVLGLILFAMFRSAIDSSMLPLLKEWILHLMKRLALTGTSSKRLMWNYTLLLTGTSVDKTFAGVFPLLVSIQKCPMYQIDLSCYLKKSLEDFINGIDNSQKEKLKAVLCLCQEKHDAFDTIYQELLIS